MDITTARQKLALHWGRRVLSRLVRDDPRRDLPVVLMVPLSPKDIARARHAIPLMQARIAHPIVRTVVVAPDTVDTRDLARLVGADFLDEAPPLEALLGGDRLAATHGWIRQQLLKLTGPRLLGTEHVLAMDSDTYPLRPTAFVDASGRHILYRGDPNKEPFWRFTERLLGPLDGAPSNFVAHSMLFHGPWLEDLFAEIGTGHAKPWIDAIMDLVAEPPETAGVMSEYDIYGHFLRRRHPERFIQRYYAGIKAPTAQFLGHAPLPAWKRRFRFLSNHERG